MSIRLLPCPKCREDKAFTPSKSATSGWIECDKCGHKGPELLVHNKDAVKLLLDASEAWNNLQR